MGNLWIIRADCGGLSRAIELPWTRQPVLVAMGEWTRHLLSLDGEALRANALYPFIDFIASVADLPPISVRSTSESLGLRTAWCVPPSA